MAQIAEHLHQAKHNFKFLESINNTTVNSLDWQVTVCFYTALHLINAHLANGGLHYRTHSDVKNAISPYASIPINVLSEDDYIAYTALQILSRRSRYLINLNSTDAENAERAAFTYDKHLAKAIRHLDRLCSFYCEKYDATIDPIVISCVGLRPGDNLKYFRLPQK